CLPRHRRCSSRAPSGDGRRETRRGFPPARAGSRVCERRSKRMAVSTEVGDDELRAFASLYELGEVLACKGIAEGVENSNYLLTTERGNFILTLYEKRVAPEDLPFFIALMDHLAHQGVPCPTPVRARDGEALRQLGGRPAAIVTFP